jgi:sugar/nucleoside kinase (ribokinase family)
MRYNIITIGSAVGDYYFFVDKKDAPVINNPKSDVTRKKLIALEFGAKIDVSRFEICYGGGVFNSAVSFSRMGLKPAAVCCVGKDIAGSEIQSLMEQEGIATEFIQKSKKSLTGLSALIVSGFEKKDRVILTARGANDDLDFSIKIKGITETDWYYTTALSGKSWKRELKDIATAVKEKKIKWAWNPGALQLKSGVSFLGKFLEFCDVFIVNRDEALELAGEPDDISRLLNYILDKGPKMVVISDGINGVYYADEHNKFHMDANRSIKALEPTGAGDAFGSGFVSGLIKTKMKDIELALRCGILNSESVIQKTGPQKGIINWSNASKNAEKATHKLTRL